jgi:hypothetical protein
MKKVTVTVLIPTAIVLLSPSDVMIETLQPLSIVLEKMKLPRSK